MTPCDPPRLCVGLGLDCFSNDPTNSDVNPFTQIDNFLFILYAARLMNWSTHSTLHMKSIVVWAEGPYSCKNPKASTHFYFVEVYAI